MNLNDLFEEKIKGVDGKACWPGRRYAGKKRKPDGTYKDICIPVKEQDVAENTSVTDYNPKSQGGTRKELLAKYHRNKDPKDAEAARKAGATQKELKTVTEMDKSETPPGRDGGHQFPPGPKVSKKVIQAVKKNPAKHLADLFDKEYAKKKPEQGVAEAAEGSQDRIKELQDYIRMKERVLGGGNALSPGERKNLVNARQELKQLKRKKQGVAEGFADDFMQMAREKGLPVRQAGTPAQERERTQQALAQRAAAQQQADAAAADQLPELKSQYDAMKKEYQRLGGSGWQYADREQNLTDAERSARAMEPEMQRLWATIQRLEQAHRPTEGKEKDERIAGLYEPHEWDAKIARLRQLAHAGPLETVWDPVQRVYKTVPANQQPKAK